MSKQQKTTLTADEERGLRFVIQSATKARAELFKKRTDATVQDFIDTHECLAEAASELLAMFKAVSKKKG